LPDAPPVLAAPVEAVVFEGEEPPLELDVEVVDEALAVVLNFSIPAVIVTLMAETDFPA